MRFSAVFRKLLALFTQRQRGWIVASILTERFGNFLLTAILSRMLTPHAFGELTSIRTLTGIVQPLAGGGGQYALLHFGAGKEEDEQRALTRSTLVFATLLSLLPIVVLLLWNTLFSHTFSQDAQKAFWIALAAIAAYNLFDITKNYYRIIGDNRRFAIVGTTYSILLLGLGSLLSLMYGIVGFVVALAIVPLAIVLPDIVRILASNKSAPFPSRSFWRYGLSVGSGALINQLLVSMDVVILFMLGTDPSLIATYKIATVIPYSLFFLPGAFLTADFVHLSHHAQNKKLLVRYIRSYLVTFGAITAAIIAMLYFFAKPLIELCFGTGYPGAPALQNILLLGVAGTFMLRIPFGNLLHAVGKAEWNVAHALTLTPFAAGAMYWAVSRYGAEGAAWSTSGMFLVSGTVCAALFGYYLKNLSDIDDTGVTHP